MSRSEIPLVLLGAGASVDAGVPTAVDMTAVMLKRIQGRYWVDSKTLRALLFVAGGIQLRKGIQGYNPLEGINIEELFACVEMLAKRHSLEIAPFVAQWHSFIDELETTRDYSDHVSNIKRELEHWLVSILEGSSSSYDNLEGVLSQLVEDLTAKPDGQLFAEANTVLINELIHIVWITDEGSVLHLFPLIQLAKRQKLSIATLNYDNTVEVAANALDIDLDTGIDFWSQSGMFKEPESGIELLKLHGSIDWKISTSLPSRDGKIIFPQEVIQQLTPKQVLVGNYRPSVVFGAGNKLTAKGPFLELLRTFRRRLENTSELLVVGYSFRDDHINQAIFEWMNRNSESKVTIIEHPEARKDDHVLWRRDSSGYHIDNRRLDERINFQNIGAMRGLEEFCSVLT